MTITPSTLTRAAGISAAVAGPSSSPSRSTTRPWTSPRSRPTTGRCAASPRWSWQRWRWRASPACTCVRSARHECWGWSATWCSRRLLLMLAHRGHRRIRPPRAGALLARLREQRGCRCLRWHAYPQHRRTETLFVLLASATWSAASSSASRCSGARPVSVAAALLAVGAVSTVARVLPQSFNRPMAVPIGCRPHRPRRLPVA